MSGDDESASADTVTKEELFAALDMVPESMSPILCILLQRIDTVARVGDRLIGYQERNNSKFEKLEKSITKLDGICKDLMNDYQINSNSIAKIEKELSNLRNLVKDQKSGKSVSGETRKRPGQEVCLWRQNPMLLKKILLP